MRRLLLVTPTQLHARRGRAPTTTRCGGALRTTTTTPRRRPQTHRICLHTATTSLLRRHPGAPSRSRPTQASPTSLQARLATISTLPVSTRPGRGGCYTDALVRAHPQLHTNKGGLMAPPITGGRPSTRSTGAHGLTTTRTHDALDGLDRHQDTAVSANSMAPSGCRPPQYES